MAKLWWFLFAIAFMVSKAFHVVPLRRRSSLARRSEGNDHVEVDMMADESSDWVDSSKNRDDISSWGEIDKLDRVLPRLHANARSLVKWVVRHGGIFDAAIDEAKSGWILRLLGEAGSVERGAVLLQVPKTLCIHSDPSRMARDDLLKNAKALMDSLSPQHWRARLAIALLSERVRSKSNYRSYLRNLPFEFWGMPVFFSTSEFALMQDFPLMQKTRDRCKFMSEFADSVLLPLQGGPRDPFSGNSADVNAFGWGFASASSRALREAYIRLDESFEMGEERGSAAAVMVPGIDLAHHSFQPNCEVVETETSYELRALKTIEPGMELTTSYGPMSNDELLADYGFTVADNPYDSMSFSMDGPMLDTARVVMGQSRVQLGASSEDAMRSEARDMVLKRSIGGSRGKLVNIKKGSGGSSGLGSSGASTPPFSGYSPWGGGHRGDLRYNENFLELWQVYWLRCLDLTGPSRDYRMHVHMGSVAMQAQAGVDGRLLAFLRVLYAPREQDLLRHGYTPFTLTEQGSMLSSGLEASVVKTTVGVLGLMLTGYPTDVETDVAMLQSEDEEMLLDSATSAAAAAALNEGDAQEGAKSVSSALSGMVGPSNYGQGKRYLAGLVEDTTLGDGLSGGSDASRHRNEEEEREKEDETVSQRTRRVLRNILTSNDEINERLYREAESANAAALATMSGLRAGDDVQDIAAAAEAAAEAALNASGEGSSLERSIVQKLKLELEGAVQAVEGETAGDGDGDGDGDSDSDEEGAGAEDDGEQQAALDKAREAATPQVTASDMSTWEPVEEPRVPHKVHFTVDISEDSYVDVGASTLAPNVRQAMLYRIRKKKGLRRVIEELGLRYEALRRAEIAVASASPRRFQGVAGGEQRQSTAQCIIPPLLPADDALGDESSKAERTKKITELVSEVAGREASESSRGEKLLSAASKLSEKWGSKGIDL